MEKELHNLIKEIAVRNNVPESWVRVFVDKDGIYSDFAIIQEEPKPTTASALSDTGSGPQVVWKEKTVEDSPFAERYRALEKAQDEYEKTKQKGNEWKPTPDFTDYLLKSEGMLDKPDTTREKYQDQQKVDHRTELEKQYTTPFTSDGNIPPSMDKDLIQLNVLADRATAKRPEYLTQEQRKKLSSDKDRLKELEEEFNGKLDSLVVNGGFMINIIGNDYDWNKVWNWILSHAKELGELVK